MLLDINTRIGDEVENKVEVRCLIKNYAWKNLTMMCMEWKLMVENSLFIKRYASIVHTSRYKLITMAEQ